MKKRLSIIFAAFLLSFSLLPVSAADSYPEPTQRFFVNDFADVIDSTDEDEI